MCTKIHMCVLIRVETPICIAIHEEAVMLSTETGLTWFVSFLYCKSRFKVQFGQAGEVAPHQFCSSKKKFVSPGRRRTMKCLHLDVIVNI